ncbi:hypothetical protein K3723_04075 [Leisingera caerulea]|uniref:hypothetical protein n=1 Tax=Leisingera caerulea TaxID=506591 RepID=UPI0021A59BB0|nr:hypothetical protein [Leisingera caerulea]UWQ63479.1 hypothetical protein K3723_04075 [Leisingera caerulea]
MQLGNDWFTVPAIDHELDGVPAQIWLSATRDVRSRNPKAKRINTEVVQQAIKAISERNAEAMALANLVVEDWSPERIAREEKRIFRGVRFGKSKQLKQPSEGIGSSFPAPEAETSGTEKTASKKPASARRNSNSTDWTIEDN